MRGQEFDSLIVHNMVLLWLITKCFDLITTLLNLYKYGYSTDSEANPVMKYLFDQWGLLGVVVVVLLSALFLKILSLRYEKRLFFKISVAFLIFMNVLVTVWNLVIYLLI